jgi:REP element-mobilizing transposase RayT
MTHFLNPCASIDRHEHRLPHWQQGAVFYFVTWRLADSLPLSKLTIWKSERQTWLACHPRPWDMAAEKEYHERFSQKIDEWLDEGGGSCLLGNAAYSTIAADAILNFNRERYTAASFVVMPNHVHVLFRLHEGQRLEETVKSWKGFSARKINELRGATGAFWQADYWDRMVRNPGHLNRCMDYIRQNPIKAGLGENEFVLYEADVGSLFRE